MEENRTRNRAAKKIFNNNNSFRLIKERLLSCLTEMPPQLTRMSMPPNISRAALLCPSKDSNCDKKDYIYSISISKN